MGVNDVKGYYAVLKIDPSADLEHIKAAFRKQVKLCHPDKNPSPEAGETYRLLTEAYAVLSNPEKRAAYDRSAAPAEAGLTPCCRCGRRVRQPRFLYFTAGRQMIGGVYCRACANRMQTSAALQNWKLIFSSPVYALKALLSVFSLSAMPPEKNYELLARHAAVYAKAGRMNQARAAAKQAMLFARTDEERKALAAYSPDGVRIDSDLWKKGLSDAVRVFIPVWIFLIAAVGGSIFMLYEPPKKDSFPDYRHIAVLPVAAESSVYRVLFDDTPAYQAPCDTCDVMRLLPKDTLVRPLGIVPGSPWVLAKTPFGETAYFRREMLRKENQP